MSPSPVDRRTVQDLFRDRLGRWSIRSLQIILVVALAAGVIVALRELSLVVIPVLIAIIIASAASPLISWLRRHGFSPIWATIVTLLGGIVVLGGIVTLVVFAVRDQWDALRESAIEGFEQLQTFVFSLDLPFELESIDPEEIQDAVTAFLTSSGFGSGALAGVSAAGAFITGVVLCVTILFFFLKDGDRIWAFFLSPLTGERHRRGVRVGATSVRVLGGYVRGTATVALVDAIGIGIGLAILQVPLALPLAVLVFLLAFIPIVGATLAGVLAALVALVANGPIVALIVVGVVVLVNQLEGNFLQPVLMGQSLKLHPLVILLALAGGTVLAGIVGAVLAVPIAAVVWAIIKAWDAPDSPVETAPEEAPPDDPVEAPAR